MIPIEQADVDQWLSGTVLEAQQIAARSGIIFVRVVLGCGELRVCTRRPITFIEARRSAERRIA